MSNYIIEPPAYAKEYRPQTFYQANSSLYTKIIVDLFAWYKANTLNPKEQLDVFYKEGNWGDAPEINLNFISLHPMGPTGTGIIGKGEGYYKSDYTGQLGPPLLETGHPFYPNMFSIKDNNQLFSGLSLEYDLTYFNYQTGALFELNKNIKEKIHSSVGPTGESFYKSNEPWVFIYQISTDAETFAAGIQYTAPITPNDGLVFGFGTGINEFQKSGINFIQT